MNDLLRKFIFSTRWGEYSLVSLYISILSGITIGLQYDPESPLYSSTTLELLIPYGSYFRSLHFYSSQLFFLLSIIHLIAVFKHSESYKHATWIKYTLSLPVGLLLLFTGYILRGDTTGSSAGIIAENILLSVPLIGDPLNDLLFSITKHHLSRVYLNHVVGLDILWIALLWQHIKRFKVTLNTSLFFIASTLFSCIFLSAPLEISKPGIFHITGPWFFIGLQELLRYLPVVAAGIILPGSFLIALTCLRKDNRYYSRLLFFLYTWVSGYALLTVIGFARS